MARANPVTGRTTSPTPGRPTKVARGRTRYRLLSHPRGGGGRKAAAPARELRRPLQPGSSVPGQPGPAERRHIVDAFVFELSKCERPTSGAAWWPGCATWTSAWRQDVADGLGLAELPEAVTPARAPITDLPRRRPSASSPTGPEAFPGRKIGVLVTDGVDAEVLGGLRASAEAQGVVVELVAPVVGGVDRTRLARPRRPEDRRRPVGALRRRRRADVREGCGAWPSPGGPGLRQRRLRPRQVHRLLRGRRAAVRRRRLTELDDGFVPLDPGADFVGRCAELRFWDRDVPTA